MSVVESLARSPLMTGNRRRNYRIPHGKKSRNPASWAAAKHHFESLVKMISLRMNLLD